MRIRFPAGLLLLALACGQGDDEMTLHVDADYGVGPEVAVGAFVDVAAVDACQGTKLSTCSTESFERLESFDISDTTVFERIQGPADRPAVVRLRAVRAGTVTLQATAVFDGVARTASLGLTAVEPERAELSVTCDDAQQGMLLETGSRIGFQLDLFAGETRLIAGGLWPIETAPAGLASVSESPTAPGYYDLQAASTAGSGVLRTSVQGSSFDLRVFALDEIDGIAATTDGEPKVGEWVWLEATPTVGGKAVCTFSGATSLTVLTPEVCFFELNDGSEGLTEERLARLSGRKAGECQVELKATMGSRTITGTWSAVLR